MTDHTNGLFAGDLARDRLHEQIARRIEKQITGAKMKPGDRLPAERVMSMKFGVSRPVVREALRTLQAKGLLAVRQGGGAYVTRPKAGPSFTVELTRRLRAKKASLDNLYEMRELLEVEAARLAAERRSRGDLQKMKNAIERMREYAAEEDRFATADLQFHLFLTRAARNPLLTFMVEAISDLLLHYRKAAYRRSSTIAVTGGLEHHEKIYRSVFAGDARRAVKDMRDHLAQAHKILSSGGKK